MTTTPTVEREPARANPGSDEALAQGCTCPIMDNARGRGWMGSGLFWKDERCPLHGVSEPTP